MRAVAGGRLYKAGWVWHHSSTDGFTGPAAAGFALVPVSSPTFGRHP